MNEANLLKRLAGVRKASRELRSADTAGKNRVLELAAGKILERTGEILAANAKDLKALKNGASAAFKDRLTLTSSRLDQISESLRQVAALPDPVGETVERRTLKNGLDVARVRAPLGVIFMIFESRPNVAVEAFSLAFKSGNAVILRGGKESMRTTAVFYEILRESMRDAGITADCLWGITDSDRAIPAFLLKQKKWIDVVVPRGGDGLIAYVTKNSEIPVIKNDRGLCHVYVHEDADPGMAERIVVNAKTQRPGVCNAMETLLIHEKIAPGLLPRLYGALEPAGVQWYACPKTRAILKGKAGVRVATKASWDTEYLDLKMNARVVESFDQAIVHIEEHGSGHSEAILTASREVARKFEAEIDAAAVYWNASTRFTDGFELGLGGELGISTQKLHVRGPVGLRELTSARWIIEGTGQVRP